MSKLEEHQFCECDECIREYRGPLSNEMRPYYLKSEADKVIAELEERIVDGDKDFEMANDQNERLLKIVRHHKYKRCLDKAELCRAKRDEIIARNPTLILNHPTEYLTRWENRWLELAKKFKGAK